MLGDVQSAEFDCDCHCFSVCQSERSVSKMVSLTLFFAHCSCAVPDAFDETRSCSRAACVFEQICIVSLNPWAQAAWQLRQLDEKYTTGNLPLNVNATAYLSLSPSLILTFCILSESRNESLRSYCCCVIVSETINAQLRSAK